MSDTEKDKIIRELRGALRAMQLATDEWAAEFTQKKRGMDWGVVNEAYVKAEKALYHSKLWD